MLKNISYKLTTVLVLSQVCFADASRPWQMDFQDPATPIMEGIINFHNHVTDLDLAKTLYQKFYGSSPFHHPNSYDISWDWTRGNRKRPTG